MNDTENNDDGRSSFSIRLCAALHAKKISTRPAVFARAFNLRAGTLSVTPHAARKWLVGEATPAQERILILSKWLNVNAAWLCFGAADEVPAAADGAVGAMSGFEAGLLQGILALSHPSQLVVQQLVLSLKALEETVTARKTPHAATMDKNGPPGTAARTGAAQLSAWGRNRS